MPHLLRFMLLILVGFVATEVVAYVLHRFLFHGILWKIHRTHHTHDHQHGLFEANDLFSVGFTGLSLWLLWIGRAVPLASVAFPLGVGIAVYGVLYFVLHDLYTHRRFFPFKTKNTAAQTIRRAHQRHHQSAEKDGLEPYGLFLFPYDRFNKPFKRTRTPSNKRP